MSAATAVIFPGQASQHVGMGVALMQASSEADAIFRLAEDVTGLPLRRLCAEGPLEDLTRTDVAQTAVVATSLAAAAYLHALLGSPGAAVAAAGHSVGELAAMCWAGALDPKTTLRLVHERGRLMQRDSAACDGTMVAVIGLSAEELDKVCLQACGDTHVQVANLNGPGQVVLSGDRAAIARASDLARAAGARRVLPLNVGGPFHSHYMSAAAGDFGREAASLHFHEPHVPIVLNTNAEATADPEELRAELGVQITSPVRWEESVRRLVGMGCSTFVELGPGEVLTGLVRRIDPNVMALAAGTPEALEQVAELLRSGVPDA